MEGFTRGWMNQIEHIGMEQNMFHLDVFRLASIEVNPSISKLLWMPLWRLI